MKYYYGNSYKEALSNEPVEITSTKILKQYEEVYSVVISADELEEQERDYDIALDEDSYELNEEDGTLKIYKEVFDDFEKDTAITILFTDEENELIIDYKMVSEDDENIYLEYLGN